MNLVELLTRAGGMLPSARVHAQGFSPHDVRVQLAAGLVVRPRRGWLALPDLPPLLRLAAAQGVVLTCVTAASHLGLWTLSSNSPHVAARRGQHVALPQGRVHRATPLKPRVPGQLLDHLDNVLALVATCLPREQALTVWDSALQKDLIDYPSLGSLPLGRSARSLLSECTPLHDSGLETIFQTRLRWLRVPIRPQAWLYGHRVDFLIGARLVVQIDGKHHEGAQRQSDRAHDTALAKRGYRVIRVGYAEVVYAWHTVEAQILDAIARRQHEAA